MSIESSEMTVLLLLTTLELLLTGFSLDELISSTCILADLLELWVAPEDDTVIWLLSFVVFLLASEIFSELLLEHIVSVVESDPTICFARSFAKLRIYELLTFLKQGWQSLIRVCEFKRLF